VITFTAGQLNRQSSTGDGKLVMQCGEIFNGDGYVRVRSCGTFQVPLRCPLMTTFQLLSNLQSC
jgi:hypothetical protein